ncbi:MAG: hypothetical protein QM763_12535 [Agriterribacter sp.]
MQVHSAIEDKYPTFSLLWIEPLELYLAFEDSGKECFIDKSGNIVYELPENSSSETYWTNFSLGNWDKWELDFSKQISYWIEIKYSEQITTCSVFSFRDGNVIRLLENKPIVKATPITPQKILLQIAENRDNLSGLTKICLYDTLKNESKELLATSYKEEPFSVHRGLGATYLFSVLTKETENKIDHYLQKIFRLYNHNGEPLADFETTIGQNGENTCFEHSGRGWGIVYKMLNEPITLSSGWYHSNYSACNVLIDQNGNCYGDFYHIAGQIPAYIGKSSTRYPKYIDRKLLCLSLPKEDNQPPYLTIVNEDGSNIVTEFECPWVIFNISRALVKDKSIFGKTCLTVIDKENYVRLIGFDGKEIENTTPIVCQSLRDNYAKQFIFQKINSE